VLDLTPYPPKPGASAGVSWFGGQTMKKTKKARKARLNRKGKQERQCDGFTNTRRGGRVVKFLGHVHTGQKWRGKKNDMVDRRGGGGVWGQIPQYFRNV